ncbi:MAG: carbohydrate ABC transporter permease [Omnitrophica WOR_2 bacterium]
MRAVPKSRRRMQNNIAFWTFFGPFFAGLLLFVYVPVFWGFALSLFEARVTITPQQFVGLANYIYMLTDPEFIHSLVTFTIYALFIVPTTFAVALGLALLINSMKRGQAFFRSVVFMPTACSYVIASLVWRQSLFNSLPFGFVNMILRNFGVEPIAWLSKLTPPFYWVPLVTVRLWLQAGFFMIIFLAGLQEIPRELYEAALVDGARRGWQTFRNITLPLLRNTSVSILILLIIAAYQAFDEFYNLLGSFTGSGGLLTQVRPPLIYLYNTAFGSQNYGRGSAGAFIVTAIILIFTIIQGRLFGFGRAVES